MLLLLIGWVVLACFLALLIGSAIEQGQRALDDAPGGVNNRDWERVTHIAHQPNFRRVK